MLPFIYILAYAAAIPAKTYILHSADNYND